MNNAGAGPIPSNLSDQGIALSRAAKPSSVVTFALVVIFALTWLGPAAALAGRINFGVLADAVRTYGRDLAASLAVALVAGVLVVWIGTGLAASTVARRAAPILALAFGALPGALVGAALIAAYNRAPTAIVYDHWPIMVLSYMARFAWVGVLAGAVLGTGRTAPMAEQARTDGAGEFEVLTRVVLPAQAPLLIAVGFVVAVLSVGEAAASSLVRTPSYNPISHVIIEKFHRFEYGMLASLSLALMLVALAAGAVAAWSLRRLGVFSFH